MKAKTLVVGEGTTVTCGILFLGCGSTGLDGAQYSSTFECDLLEPAIINDHIAVIESHLQRKHFHIRRSVISFRLVFLLLIGQ